MSTPKVSIIVPIYKTEKFLDRCLNSLRAQTLEDIEIILVDDGSPDNCPALCDKAAAEDDRIKVIHKKNGGLGMARNSGIEAAEGEFVGFVDSDDYVALDMFELLYNAAIGHNAELSMSGMCFVGGNMFSSEDEYIEKPYFENITFFDTPEKIDGLMLGVAGALPSEPDDSRYGMSVCKNIFSLKTLKEKNLRFLSERKILSEDALFMMDFVAEINSAVGIPQCLYRYCRNGESLSKSYNSTRFERSLVFLDELENRLAARVSKETYGIYLDRLAGGFGRVLCSAEIMHAKEEGMSYFALRKRLKEICTCPKISAPLKTYPIWKLPIKQAIFAFTIKHKLYFLQKILVTLRTQ